MSDEKPRAIPAAFGPNRIAEVWNKPPFERAKPFWEALQWLEDGNWQGVVTSTRAKELKKGIHEAIRRTCGDLTREYCNGGKWRDRKWPLWRANRTSGDDAQCLYCTGILPPRIACWPEREPYPTDALELSKLHQEMSDWSYTPAATSQFSETDLELIRSAAAMAFGDFWKKLTEPGNA